MDKQSVSVFSIRSAGYECCEIFSRFYHKRARILRNHHFYLTHSVRKVFSQHGYVEPVPHLYRGQICKKPCGRMSAVSGNDRVRIFAAKGKGRVLKMPCTLFKNLFACSVIYGKLYIYCRNLNCCHNVIKSQQFLIVSFCYRKCIGIKRVSKYNAVIHKALVVSSDHLFLPCYFSRAKLPLILFMMLYGFGAVLFIEVISNCRVKDACCTQQKKRHDYN